MTHVHVVQSKTNIFGSHQGIALYYTRALGCPPEARRCRAVLSRARLCALAPAACISPAVDMVKQQPHTRWQDAGPGAPRAALANETRPRDTTATEICACSRGDCLCPVPPRVRFPLPHTQTFFLCLSAPSLRSSSSSKPGLVARPTTTRGTSRRTGGSTRR